MIDDDYGAISGMSTHPNTAPGYNKTFYMKK
jgi:hypothetical protein